MAPSFDRKAWIAINLLIATIIAIAVFAVPISYYVNSSTQLRSEMMSSLKHGRYQLEKIINKNPEFWQYEIHRMEGIILNLQSNPRTSIWKIKDINSKVLLEVNPYKIKIDGPRLVKNIAITDSHNHVALIEVEVSTYHEMVITSLLAIIGVLVGSIAYLGIARIPLRAIEKLWNQMAHQALHDELTNLANRTYFYKVLSELLSNRKKANCDLAVLTIDLDHFKDVNDTLGHAAGDQLLKKVVLDFQSIIGGAELIARLGGDEFAIILTGENLTDYASSIADQIIDRLSLPYEIEGEYVYIGASLGIAIEKNYNIDADEFIKRADIALYEAKNKGRNTYCIFQHQMNQMLMERKTIEEKLRVAIENDDFQLHFQPQYNLVPKKLIGVEALIRWQHKDDGFISPQKFIPVAEKSGLIIDIDKWVLTNACKQIAKWDDLRVAVNISPMHFHSDELLKNVRYALEQSGLPATRLELEITEGILLHETEKTIEILKALKDMGIRIAMDDFGTGYSSLSYLQCFPFDKIKIDRSFISTLSDKKPESEAIVRAIVSMSNAMNMRVNAEGVETYFQAKFLSLIGCEEVQGYYFGKPMSLADLSKTLEKNQTDATNVTPLFISAK